MKYNRLFSYAQLSFKCRRNERAFGEMDDDEDDHEHDDDHDADADDDDEE